MCEVPGGDSLMFVGTATKVLGRVRALLERIDAEPVLAQVPATFRAAGPVSTDTGAPVSCGGS
ncbi:hypothetical protein SAMN05421837_102775 [Amycolatopsis pretoriensis]|uniref:Uncharacterized protein n=1 Tax=Amycolatopsis pretoriensis TaxID=218821 RepID=A0A1H5QEN9_9PSEU|nr:hypothetical protein [Amycolatopsis pretoriensis]SEF24580.1 hypothetical protein SAMN05421837_102775 [Amycolatopsis pretoriensis]